jgi:predicted Ser/Thr protein kinase
MIVDADRAVERLRRSDPRELGGYDLIGRLGSGGMGVVYLARARDGQRVAVKAVHAELAGRPEFVARFRSEVEQARQVPSFCTAEVLDADPGHDPPYLVVEYVDGPSVDEAVEQHGPLSPANLHAMAIGVASALSAIHGAGVIHRDLKPGNVLLAPGSPKVIDFGIARALEEAGGLTGTGQMLGTVAYMAPERFSGHSSEVGPAADVFAWGAVVAYAGLGHVPFPGRTPTVMAARILHDEPDLDGLPAGLRELVTEALSKDPADRPTARQLLDRLLDEAPQPARHRLLDADTATHRSRRRVPSDIPGPRRPVQRPPVQRAPVRRSAVQRPPARPVLAQVIALLLLMLGLLVGGIALLYADDLAPMDVRSAATGPVLPGTTAVAAAGGVGGAAGTLDARAAKTLARIPIRAAIDDGRCLGARDFDDVVELTPCAATAGAGQTWNLVDDGTLRIGDRCLDARRGGLALADCNASDTQQWNYATTGQFVLGESRRCIDVQSARPFVADCAPDRSQRWVLQ